MESRLAQLVTRAQTAEKQFDQKLANPTTPLETVVAYLREFRLATDEILECDFLYARTSGVETPLWHAHSQLNSRLRKQLSKLRKERSSKPVETRKLTKFYLEFLKDSQRYYRDYIQKLNARFGGIAELQRIAHQVKTDTIDARHQTQPSPQVQTQVVSSCYQTLIYLGDLFRYRAAERLDKTPDWGPAIGYYALATSLRPASGMAFHQQSVVAFDQGDYLRSTYYLYRAINVGEPHPNAIPNLELQFKKITSGWEKGELVPKNLPNDKSASRKALLAWFIRFHSMCYKGKHFSQYEELEKEVLSRTGSELKKGTLDGILPKMMFINFAAQATAAAQFQKKPERQDFMQSYFFFLRLNIRFFSTLLDGYAGDLEKLSGQDRGPRTEKKLSHNITQLARHVLPCLRLYSIWLLSNAHIVAAQVGDEVLLQTSRQFWATYASVMSTIVSIFPFSELPSVGYQLEEDVDAYAFTPLESDRSRKLWFDMATGGPKPKFNDPDLPRLDIDTEMLARVRELLVDALILAVDGDAPINFTDSKFVAEDAASLARLPVHEDLGPQLEQIRITPPIPESNASSRSMLPPVQEPLKPQPKSSNREADLKNMVDDLVGPEEDEDEDPAPTPPVQSFTPTSMLNPGGYPGTILRNGALSKSTSPRAIPPIRTPEMRPAAESWQSSNSPLGRSSQRLQSVSSIWNDVLPRNTSPMTPNPINGFGPPRASSNASMYPANNFGHSRVNSMNSPKSSLPNEDGWSSFEPTPLTVAPGNGRYDNRLGSLQGTGLAQSYSGMQSPLLFGAGGGPWSTAPRGSFSNATPPNGQGG